LKQQSTINEPSLSKRTKRQEFLGGQ